MRSHLVVIVVIMVTDVTIRDIEYEIYNEFSAEARRQDKPIGALTTEAMGAHLRSLHPSESESVRTISGLDELSISKKDLEEGGIRVGFFEIGNLVFEDDVDLGTFDKYVENIFECDAVELPGQLPKLRALSKCRECGVYFRKRDT